MQGMDVHFVEATLAFNSCFINKFIYSPMELSSGLFTFVDPDSNPYLETDFCTIQILAEKDPL